MRSLDLHTPAAAGPSDLDQQPYRSSWEHLADELARLDLIAHLRLRQPGAPSAPDPRQPPLGPGSRDHEAPRDKAGKAAADADRALGEKLDRALRVIDRRIEDRLAAGARQQSWPSLIRLSRLFALNAFETQILLICLAPEIDSRYERLFCHLLDDAGRRRPSVELVLALLCEEGAERIAARRVFDHGAPLRRYRLLRLAGQGGEAAPVPRLLRELSLDERIVGYLLDSPAIDEGLQPAARLEEPRAIDLDPDLVARAERYLAMEAPEGELGRSLVFHCPGPDGTARRALAGLLAARLGLPVLSVDLARVGATPPAQAAWLAAREAFLQPAVLHLDHFELLRQGAEAERQLQQWHEGLETFSQIAVLGDTVAWRPRQRPAHSRFIQLPCALPDASRRAALWRRRGEDLDERTVGLLASQFRFAAAEIDDTLLAARDAAAWRGAPSPDESELLSAARGVSSGGLDQLTRATEARYTWQDIVLPDEAASQLRELCAQARHRHVVLGNWGFERKLPYGKGLSALFAGPPGTGKTMAAQVIAGELGLALYRIDLSQIVSKYIGETEKNLDRIFTAAEAGNAILFFDEADALFGKRSEVRDSHDRYANVEISYLLQKMEEYDGTAILATNLRQNMDQAFIRRLQFIIEFPFPDTAHRQRIWEVVFPAEAPLGADVDFAQLARLVRLSGGNIKNIGLAAAFLAAADGGVIGMEQLVQAARREYQKVGRPWLEREQAAAS